MTTAYKIKDIAERSGFTAATLRYYEGIGLLPESTRSPAGYRLYDDRTLDRLAFIARAKQLGCRLGEIAELALAWEGGQCGPVQDRLRAVVADKLVDAEQQIAELMTLSSELQQAAKALELHRPDGPCDEKCGCLTDPVPIACTLSSASMRGRLDDWQALLVHVIGREQIADGVRVTFGPATPLDELIGLSVAEQDCCQFFSFAITVDSRGVALEVHTPPEALDVVHSMFGIQV